MLRLQHERILKASPRPGKLLASQLGVTHSNVQLYGVRVERESLSEHTQRLFILAFVVKLMGALVVLFRTQERGGHREQASSSEGCSLPIVPGGSAKFNGFSRPLLTHEHSIVTLHLAIAYSHMLAVRHSPVVRFAPPL